MIPVCAMCACFLLGFAAGSYLTDADNRDELRRMRDRMRVLETMNLLYSRARRDH